MNLHKEAAGRECLVRLVGCNRNPETTVLAHLNDKRIFMCGMGLKVPDVFGAHCCSACHDILDGRQKSDYTAEELKIAHMEAVLRTQNMLLNEGKIKT